MGTAIDFETAAAPLPVNDGSIQRKLDDTNAHGLDTDNNSSDFEVLAVSAPRNSTTIVATPTPTPTPTPTASPLETPSPTPTQTSIPSSSPTPTASPTPTPTPASTPKSASKTGNGQIIGVFNFHHTKIVCRVKYKAVHRRWHFGFFPEITCSRD